jgi:WD40 repeat protein
MKSDDDLDTAVLDGEPASPDDAPAPAKLDPRYAVVGEIARGGIGRILRTEDATLGREVALKRLIDPLPEHRRRFSTEARITARLAHPAIVPLYDAGDLDGGDPYYTMKLVSGRSLADVIAKTQSFSDRIALLPSIAAVADAIAYAHSRRVLHRDLKPSNVLLGDFGETVVIDWGLAKDLDAVEPPSTGESSQDSSLTSVGQVVGTPAYMAPEQAAGKPLDARADVYALGAMLYHTLTGAPPYKDVSREQLIPRIIAGPPPPITTREPKTPRDLAAIITKATAHDPANRYPDAGALAADLRRFTTGQLVGAFAYSRRSLFWRWMRRHRVAVTVGLALGALLAGTAIVAVRRIVAERNIAEARANDLRLAQARAILPNDPTAAMAWLKTHHPTDESWPAAQATALEAESLGVARAVFHTEITDGLVAFSPAARLIVVGGGRELRAVTLGTPGVRPLATLAEGTISDVDVARAGDLVAAGDTVGKLTLVPASGGTVKTLQAHDGLVTAVRFAPGGAALVTFGLDGGATKWERGGRTVRTIRVPGGYGLCAAWRGDEPLVGTANGQLFAWTAATLHPLASGLGECESVYADETRLAFIDASGISLVGGATLAVPQARVAATARGLVVVGTDDGSVVLADLETNTTRPLGRLGGPVTALALAGDGRVAAGATGGVRVFQGGNVLDLRGQTGRIVGIGFFEGDELVSVGDDGSVRVWGIATPTPTGFGDAGDGVHHFGWLDEQTIVEASYKGVVTAWTRAGQPSRLGSHGGSAVIAVGSGLVASSGKDGDLALWSRAQAASRSLARLDAQVLTVSLAEDGSEVAAAAIDNRIVIVPTAGGAAQTLTMPDEMGLVAYPPRGRFLAIAGREPTMRLVGKGNPLKLEGHRKDVYRVAFSPSAEWLASASADHTARVWHLPNRGSSVLAHDAPLTDVAFVDETHVLTSTRTGNVFLWAADGQRQRSFTGHSGWVYDVTVSPDRRFAASAGADGTARLWDLTTGTASVLRGHTGKVKRVAFSPDGQTLATGGEDGMIRLWPVAVPAVPREGFTDWLNSQTSAQLDQAGRVVTPMVR